MSGRLSRPSQAASDRLNRSMPALFALVAVTAVWGVTFVQVKDAVAIYPLAPVFGSALRNCLAGAARPGRARVRSLGRGGLGAAALAGGLLAAGYVAPDVRAPADERLERRLRHRDVRRSDTAASRSRSSGSGWARRPGSESALATGGLAMLAGVHGGSVERRPARARRRSRLLAADRADGALRAALRRDRVHARRDGGRVRRALARGDSDRRRAARLDGLGRAARDGHLRERARVSRPDLGAAPDERDADGARLHARAGLGGDLRLHARRRPARCARVGRLRGDHGRDRARGARRGPDARPAASAGRRPRDGHPALPRLGGLLRRDDGGDPVRPRAAAARPGAALAMLTWGTAIAIVAALSAARFPPLVAVLPRGLPRARLLAGPVHALGARGRSVADVGDRGRRAARRGRNRARLPRRAGAHAARPRRAGDRRRRRRCSRPSATGPSTCARSRSCSRSARWSSLRCATTSSAPSTRTRTRRRLRRRRFSAACS